MVKGKDPRLDAQRRADRIRAFREELAELTREGVTPLSGDQKAALEAHHDRVLATLASRFDVDRTARAGQLSRGLQLASIFGAGTLVAAVTTLITRFWAGLSLPAQVTLLTMFPLVALAGVELSARRERTRYVAALFALVACGTAWTAIYFTADLLDIPLSLLLLWPGVLFGLAVAASYGFRLVLAISLAALLVAVSGGFFAASDVPWDEVFSRHEPLALSAFALIGLAKQLAPFGYSFERVARLTGMVIGLGALLVLSSAEGTSLLPFDRAVATHVHQGLMLVVSILVIVLGLRAGDTEAANVGVAFLAVFLLVRYVDWFWDRLPAWAFFLILAACSFAGIAILRRLRRRLEAA